MPAYLDMSTKGGVDGLALIPYYILYVIIVF